MSAFVVSHDHIDALVQFAINQRLRYRKAVPAFRGGTAHVMIDITTDNATEVGQILLRENVRSVLDRYPNCTEADAPGREGEFITTYDFAYFDTIDVLPQHKLVGLILSACSCFDYQSCETNDYEESVACGIIEAIRTEAIRMIPKYDAPWEVTRDAVKTFAKAR